MASLFKTKSLKESIMGDNILKGFFGGNKEQKQQPLEQKQQEHGGSPRRWIKELSPLANIVVTKCARILLHDPEELKKHFEEEAPESAKKPPKYARNFLEYCCFRALSVVTQTSDHLSDKDFRRLTFDMMLSWETPGAASKPAVKTDEDEDKGASAEPGTSATMEEDSALFYTDLMPMLVDVESTVGPDAFCRIAPAIPTVSDIITAHPQFEALTAGTGGRLPFPVFDKYLGELDKCIKTMRSLATPSLLSNLHLSKNEMIVDVDGTATTQPVLQHVGVSTWPGRLTLTDRAFYFESTGVVSYDKPKKYDLSADLHHVVKPDLTGPWGARLFDKAVHYKSDAIAEPVILEFPELTGHTRRDYWLAIIQEIIQVHQFIKTHQLEGVGRSEARAKAVLGIARLRATREAFHMLPLRPSSLLTFSLGEEIPGGDLVLEALAESLRSTDSEGAVLVGKDIGDKLDGNRVYTSLAVTALGAESGKDAGIPVGERLVGELTPLEQAVQQSRSSSKKVELAQTTIDGVKVEGIGTNVAVMKELIVPFNSFVTWVAGVASWQEPLKAAMFCVMFSYIIYRDWVKYLVPITIGLFIAYILWLRYAMKGRRDHEIVVPPPPGQSTLEQLMQLQEAISQVEGIIQAANICLLKVRALILSQLPEATDRVLLILGGVAIVLAVLPLRIIALILFLDIFTRQMHVRRENSERFNRRLREWWYSIPVVPVRVGTPEEMHQ